MGTEGIFFKEIFGLIFFSNIQEDRTWQPILNEVLHKLTGRLTGTGGFFGEEAEIAISIRDGTIYNEVEQVRVPGPIVMVASANLKGKINNGGDQYEIAVNIGEGSISGTAILLQR
ncbi:MAG: hypothetical protein ACI9VM_000444 [Candidatus Azotimanducaceae bacterium]|jgi:hypothetical protein